MYIHTEGNVRERESNFIFTLKEREQLHNHTEGKEIIAQSHGRKREQLHIYTKETEREQLH